MKLTWITLLLSHKSLVLMALPATVAAYIPSRVTDDLDDVFFVIVGWIISVLLTTIEYSTSVYKTKKLKQEGRKELFSKIIIYTMVFFVLKFFHLWTSFEAHHYLAVSVSFLVMLSYAIVCLGEFKFIGNNLFDKYGKKPSIFALFDRIEKALTNMVVKKIEKSCNLNTGEEE